MLAHIAVFSADNTCAGS